MWGVLALAVASGLAHADTTAAPANTPPAEAPPSGGAQTPPSGIPEGGVPVPVAAPRAAPAVADRVVAVVNDKVITLSEVYAFHDYIEQAAAEGSRREAERQVMEQLIQRLLIDQEVSRLKLDVTDQEIDRQIDEIARKNNLDREQMQAEIVRQGMSWEQYRTELGQSMREMKFGEYVLRPRISVTDDELRDRYRREHPGSAASVEAAHLQAIFLAFPPAADEAARAAVVAQAADLRKQAVAGADFGALSAANDQAGFGAQGGEMGTFKPGELNESLDRVVVGLASGAISEPVVLPQGVFLVRVVERSTAQDGFEASRDAVFAAVFQDRMVSEQERWFEQARRAAIIKVLVDADLNNTAPLPAGVEPARGDAPPTEGASGPH